jgi:hypothetical protein
MKRIHFKKIKKSTLNQFLKKKGCILFFQKFHLRIEIQSQILLKVRQLNGQILFGSSKQFSGLQNIFLAIKLEPRSVSRFIIEFPSLKKYLLIFKLDDIIYSSEFIGKLLLQRKQKVQVPDYLKSLKIKQSSFVKLLITSQKKLGQQFFLKQTKLIQVIKKGSF